MTLTLTTFVPGTKAKADEVNANFSALQKAVNEKATMDGNSAQNFSVANGSQNSHAVNKAQLDGLSDDLTAKINKFATKFCVKSGNTTNGKGDLFSYSVLKITPKIGGTYNNLVIADYEGTQTTISAAAEMNLTGNSNGDYNIFINTKGELYILNNTIYKQAPRPTMAVNDIWLNTSAEPLECVKYSGTSDTKFLDVPLGKVTIKDGTITALKTFPFNQNGYNVNSETIGYRFPDYSNGTAKLISTNYTAECDGWLYCESKIICYSEGFIYCTINSIKMTINEVNGDNSDANASLATIPVSKGDTYSFSTSGGSIGAFSANFYSAKGAI